MLPGPLKEVPPRVVCRIYSTPVWGPYGLGVGPSYRRLTACLVYVGALDVGPSYTSVVEDGAGRFEIWFSLMRRAGS